MGVSTSAQQLVDWFGNNSWRMSKAAYKEAQVRREHPEFVPGSEEFYAEVLRLCKEENTSGND